jgi:metal-sulfur cluster biosynthetic enzyme
LRSSPSVDGGGRAVRLIGPPGYHGGMSENPAATSDEHAEVLTEDDVLEALEEVIDPELGLDFVSLGLVYDVEIENSDVYVTFTLTTPACPIGPQVSEQMKEFVGDLPGVTAVHPKMVFDPPWSPEMMTEDAKFALGF